ncbi:MAG: twin-arginine translocase subunit TatC, partial [Cytophagales bacterium]
MDNKNMTFADHLEELRWHFLRSGFAILIFVIIAFGTMNLIFKSVILAPSNTDFITYRVLCDLGKRFSMEGLCVEKIDFKLQSRQLAGQFTMHLLSAFVVGFILAFPYIFWEFWKFVKPGLLPNEQKAVSGAVLVVSLLFFIGILFGYFVVAPMSIQFLANY